MIASPLGLLASVFHMSVRLFPLRFVLPALCVFQIFLRLLSLVYFFAFLVAFKQASENCGLHDVEGVWSMPESSCLWVISFSLAL